MLSCRRVLRTIGLRTGREQCWSSQERAVRWNSSKLLVDTIPLKDSNSGLMIMLKIQNFQFCRILLFTYSSNMSFMWSNWRQLTGTPVAGSSCWQEMMVVLSSSISSRNLRASSCICIRSCCSLVMYSMVFCSVMAWLVCLELLEIKLFSVLKPILILKRLFCSAEMCFCRFFNAATFLGSVDFPEQLFWGD